MSGSDPLKILALIVLVMVPGAYAQEKTTRDGYRDFRWLGRGNAGIAAVNDGLSGFYNPAGIGRNEIYIFNFLDTSFGGNSNIAQGYTAFNAFVGGDGTLSTKLEPLLGVPMGLQGNFFPHVAVPGLVVGFFDYGETQFLYSDPVYPRLNLYARNDYGGLVGFGAGIADRFYWGLSLRYTRRLFVDEAITSAALLNYSSTYLASILRRGNAFGLNGGVQYHQPMGAQQWFGLGLAVEDFGATTFTNSSRLRVPSRQEQQINAGVAYGLNLPLSTIGFYFDVRQLYTQNIDITKRIHFGMDVELVLLDLRAGFNEGYWTAGLTLKVLPLIDIDLVTYGEEIGAMAGQQQNRYYLIGLKLGMDLKDKKVARRKQRFTLDKF